MSSRSRTALLAALLALTGIAHAGGRGGPVDVAIVDRDTGDALPQYAHRGQPWVPGTPGHRYAVRLSNRSPSRVLVVLSVDGVNAITGQTAATGQAGYVLAPYATADVTGWRKSLRDVAQFRFTDLPDSYAARTGRPRDVGVVGVAVFDEAPPPAALAEQGMADAVASAPAARAQRQELGTGHGPREYAPVDRTDFEPSSRTPVQVTEIRYDDLDALVRRGIVPDRDRRYGRRDAPQAFPGGFVPDPPQGW